MILLFELETPVYYFSVVLTIRGGFLILVCKLLTKGDLELLNMSCETRHLPFMTHCIV